MKSVPLKTLQSAKQDFICFFWSVMLRPRDQTGLNLDKLALTSALSIWPRSC